MIVLLLVTTFLFGWVSCRLWSIYWLEKFAQQHVKSTLVVDLAFEGGEISAYHKDTGVFIANGRSTLELIHKIENLYPDVTSIVSRIDTIKDEE